MARLTIGWILPLVCILLLQQQAFSKPSATYRMTNDLNGDWDEIEVREEPRKTNLVFKSQKQHHERQGIESVDKMSLHDQVVHLQAIIDRTFKHVSTNRNDKGQLWSQNSLSAFDWAIFKSLGLKLKNMANFLTCGACKIIVQLLQHLVSKQYTKLEIRSILTYMCIKLNIEDKRICTLATREFQEEVLTVFDKLVLSPSEACGIIVGESCGSAVDPGRQWNITLPKVPKPPVTPAQPPKSGSPEIRILHISDIHVDFRYKPGSNAKCNEPLCCRENDGPVVNHTKAGYWGDYNYCDTPTWLIEALFKHLKENETFDYVYWTGDLAGHNVWNQSREDQIKVQAYLNNLFLKYFPGKLILPSIGNHDSAPVNSFPPPFIDDDHSISWLYNVLAQNWSHWLPKDTMNTVKKGSYYTLLLKPGFRVVSLNTNYCNNDNWWLLLNETDPADELKWLINILQHSENNNEKVHILGHMPPGQSGCLKYWSWNLYKIINRYESTVKGSFFGHTHDDHFFLFYDEATKFTRPTSIGYVGQSVTPYKKLNPGYRVYTVDGFYPNSSFMVLDHVNYIVNLTEANKSKDPPKWHFEYSAKNAYHLKNLFPADWNNLIDEFNKNDTLFHSYYRHFNKMSPEFEPCTGACKKSMLCELRTGRSYDPKLCKDLLNEQEFKRFIRSKKLNARC